MTTRRQIEEAHKRIEEARQKTAKKTAAPGMRFSPNTALPGKPKTSLPRRPELKGPEKPDVSTPIKPNVSRPLKPGQVKPMETPPEISSCYLFRDLTQEAIGQLVPVFSEKSYRVNETIFSEGETARTLFVIKSGRVELKMNLHLGTRGNLLL